MTITESAPILASTEDLDPKSFVQYLAPNLPETRPAIGLTGYRIDNELSLCDPTAERFSNCPLPRVWMDPCDPAYDPQVGQEDKCSVLEWDQALFRPVEFYDLNEAPCVDPLLDPQAISNQNISENTAWAVTSALDSGLGVTTTTLRNANPDPGDDLTPGVAPGDPGAAVDPGVAIMALTRAMATRGLGSFSIVAPFWALDLMDDQIAQRGGTLRTRVTGIPVLTGLGLSGVGPDSTGNIDLVSSGEAYLYAMRSVPRYRLGEVQQYASAGTMVHERTNASMAEGMRKLKVVFDAGCIYAIRVCLNRVACCG